MRTALAFEAEPFEIVPELGEFTPTPVETAGGGRIKDKRAPNPADVVTVKGYNGRRVPLHRLAAGAWRAPTASRRRFCYLCQGTGIRNVKSKSGAKP